MNALDWRTRMKHAPRLVHDNGLVIMLLGEHSVVFPSEEDARFFAMAYTDLPNAASEAAYLRTQLDAGALAKAEERSAALGAEVQLLKQRQGDLERQLAGMAEKAAVAAGRARVLANAIIRQAKK